MEGNTIDLQSAFAYVDGLECFKNNVNGGLIDSPQDESKNIGAHVGTKIKTSRFNPGATNIGPRAGGISNNRGPGAGGLNSGPAAGSINFGGIGSINFGSIDTATSETRIRPRSCTTKGPGAGAINNSHGPGAGGLTSFPGARFIKAGLIDIARLFGFHRMTKNEIRKYLIKWDKDGNGVLSKQEIKEAMHNISSFAGYRAEIAVEVADKDGDGCVNMNDDEFEALIDYVYDLGVMV